MEDEVSTIPEMLRLRAEINSDLRSFSFYDRHGLVSSLTPREIYTLSGRFAYLLRTWGFRSGDVIANGLPNSPERIVTDFGVIMAGCVLTNCQIIEKDGRDFWHTANTCQARGVVIPLKDDNPSTPHQQVFSPYLSSLPIFTPSEAAAEVFDVEIPKAAKLRKIIVCYRTAQQDRHNSSLLDNLRSMDAGDFFQCDSLPSDLAFLAPTSGSSGFNKLVSSTHEKVLRHGRSYKSSTSLVYFNDRPMGWMGGFPYDFLASGVRRVLQDAFNNQQTQAPSQLWSILTHSHCLGAVLTPLDLYTLIDHFHDQPPEHKLLFIVAGGEPINKDLLTKALCTLCQCMRVSYGSTEAGVVALDSISDHKDYEEFYCGRVKDDVQIKIVDNNGNETKHGTSGEMYLKSERVMQQYYYNYNAQNEEDVDCPDSPSTPTPTPTLFSEDGWYKTGDLGALRAGRKLYCYGRKADVISLGSRVIYLSWPESILSKCSLIQASSVVGIETSKGNVVFGAFVVSKNELASLTPEQVTDFFESQIIDTEYRNKIRLSYVEVCDRLPQLPSGKVNKPQMKRILRDKLSAL